MSVGAYPLRRARGNPAGESGLPSYGNVRIAIWGQSNAIGRALRSDIAAAVALVHP